MAENFFIEARPVWPVGREREKNLTAAFRAVFSKPEGSVIFRVAASTLYRFYVNGQFAGHGPARGPHGYFRVDEWNISENMQQGENLIVVEVAGYNVNSYYLTDQPAFLQAEVISGSQMVAATSTTAGAKSFACHIPGERLQRVQRYSFQRPFVEAYRLNQDSQYRWLCDCTPLIHTPCAEAVPKRFIPRRLDYPRFDKLYPDAVVAAGTVLQGEMPDSLWKDRSLTQIGEALKGYREEELELHLSDEVQSLRYSFDNRERRPAGAEHTTDYQPGTFRIYEFTRNFSGFVGLGIRCTSKARLLLLFDEVLREGDVDFKRMDCVNAISWELAAGEYRLESFEPYTLRYLKVLVLEGNCQVEGLYLREYANPSCGRAAFVSDSLPLNAIYEAALETFRQNAVDIYMDCPSRERAGWLCDSFFTSRVEYLLTGRSAIEKNFLENFMLPERFEYLPEGMLPMCYPSDHNDGIFIPNWALWFVVELEEYLERSGDRELVDGLKERVYKLFDYFRPFLNEYGLLEKLESWVFLEWSKANEFIQDVNFPSNMLYAGALAAAGRLYEDTELLQQAQSLQTTIREMAFDGEFFIDNAVRSEKGLEVTRNRTEVCQYYSFYFDVATPESHGALWNILLNRFGPDRAETGAWPEIYPANAFIGNYLRLDLLSRYGEGTALLEEMTGYFHYMAEKTGTLWENIGDYASCNHGFASHTLCWIYKHGLGIHQIDKTNHKVVVRLHKNSLASCEGSLPVGEGQLQLGWQAKDGRILLRASLPEAYQLEIQNDSGLELEIQKMPGSGN